MYSQQYYQGPNVVPTLQRRYRTVNNTIPGVFSGLLGAVQLFLWIAIIILEIVSVFYDPGRGTIYAGFWCSTIFLVTWASMFCYLCCGKSSRCASYLFVINIINSVFTIVLLVFTAIFVNDPCRCFGALCYIPHWQDLDNIIIIGDRTYPCIPRTLRKLPVLNGLLACAVLMLVCNIVFILTYTIISIRLRVKARSYGQTPDVMYQQHSGSVLWSEQSGQHPSNVTYPPQQYRQMYPMHNTQRTSQWPSVSPTQKLYSEKF